MASCRPLKAITDSMMINQMVIHLFLCNFTYVLFIFKLGTCEVHNLLGFYNPFKTEVNNCKNNLIWLSRKGGSVQI